MKKYGLIGYSLAHSISPFIHRKLFGLANVDAEYDIYEIDEINKEIILELTGKLDGFNITIPYKKVIIEYLKEVDYSAQLYQAVNTVKVDGMIGFNTDVDGFIQTLRLLGIHHINKVLILGAGGVAQMVAVEMAQNNTNITIAVRKSSFYKAKELTRLMNQVSDSSVDIKNINEINDSFDLLINCTPVGMYPNINQSPVSRQVVNRCGAVIDLVYNPTQTKLMAYAQKAKIPHIGGMPMLVYQAAKAQELWNKNAQFSPKDLVNLIEEGKAFIKNCTKNSKRVYVFVGFMASGKTTLSKMLANCTALDYIDIDNEISKQMNLTIPEIFNIKGQKFFRRLERKILKNYLRKENIIISAGGGAAIYNKKLLFDSNAVIIYIDTPFEVCHKRILEQEGRPIANNLSTTKLLKLYNQRAEIYEQVADIKVNGKLDTYQQVCTLKEFFNINVI